MFIYTPSKATLFELPKPLALCVKECAKVTWAYQGISVPLREITERPESHCLIYSEKNEPPRCIAFGSQADVEKIFAALVAAISRDERIFNVEDKNYVDKN